MLMGSARFELAISAMSRRCHNQLDQEPSTTASGAARITAGGHNRGCTVSKSANSGTYMKRAVPLPVFSDASEDVPFE